MDGDSKIEVFADETKFGQMHTQMCKESCEVVNSFCFVFNRSIKKEVGRLGGGSMAPLVDKPTSPVQVHCSLEKERKKFRC